MAKQRTTVHVSLSSVDGAINRIVEKLHKRINHYGDFCYASRHEAIGLIQEEINELWDAVRENDNDDFESELIDVAVGCIFALASSRTWQIHNNLNVEKPNEISSSN